MRGKPELQHQAYENDSAAVQSCPEHACWQRPEQTSLNTSPVHLRRQAAFRCIAVAGEGVA